MKHFLLQNFMHFPLAAAALTENKLQAHTMLCKLHTGLSHHHSITCFCRHYLYQLHLLFEHHPIQPYTAFVYVPLVIIYNKDEQFQPSTELSVDEQMVKSKA